MQRQSQRTTMTTLRARAPPPHASASLPRSPPAPATPPAPHSRPSAPAATLWRLSSPPSPPSPMPACAYIQYALISSLIEILLPRIGFPTLRIISLPPSTPTSPLTRLSIPFQFRLWIKLSWSVRTFFSASSEDPVLEASEFWFCGELQVCAFAINFKAKSRCRAPSVICTMGHMLIPCIGPTGCSTSFTTLTSVDLCSHYEILQDVQFRVPMESRRDVDKVKDALDVDGVQGVNCDLASQTVTVTGNVPYHRLLKKLKHVKRKSRLIGFIPDNQAYSPSYVNPYSSYHGSSSYHGRMPIRRPLSPPHLRSTSYVAHPMERTYYEDYEDYRPSRYSDF